MRLRLTVITSLLVFTAVLIMGVHSALRERRLLLKESIAAKGHALVTTLTDPCLEALSNPNEPDHQRLDRYLASLTDQPELDVWYAAVIDDEGRIVSHTDPEKYGEKISGPFALAALKATHLSQQEGYDSQVGDVIEFAQPLAIEKLRFGTLIVGLSVERLQAQLRAGYLGSMFSALAIIGPLAILLFLLYSRTIVKPVMALADGVRQVAEGDLSARVVIPENPSGRDEFGDLVRGFNAMVHGLRERERLKGELEVARRLEEAHQELAKAHARLEVAHQDLARAHEELKLTQGQLIQAEKMAALGQLVAGVAHEINNPVNFLVQSIELLRGQLADLEQGVRQEPPEIDAGLFQDVNRCLEIMTDGAERTAGIVRKLRDFSRREASSIARVDLVPVLDGTLELLHYEVRGRIRIDRRYEPVDPIEGDPHQLGQVFLNLLNNAAQAIHGEGTITVRLAQDDRGVYVVVQDTGEGIAPEHLPRIFDPFFTTKDVGKGTGLGLSLSYQIVQRHGGEIRAESQPGQGATFTVRLPRRPSSGTAEGGGGPAQQDPDHDTSRSIDGAA